MKALILDIDGVLNNCISVGMFHESSTHSDKIAILNKITDFTGAAIIIVSSWAREMPFEKLKSLLFTNKNNKMKRPTG